MNNTEVKKFMFLAPEPTKASNVALLICIIGLFAWFIIYYSYIYINWDTYKCNEGMFYLAPFFGKSSKNTLDECLKKEETVAINDALEDVNNEINNIDKSLNKLNQEIDMADNGESLTSTITGLSTNLQQNVIHVKNAIAKILSAVVISTHLNDGILTTTKSLNNSSLANVINSFTPLQIKN